MTMNTIPSLPPFVLPMEKADNYLSNEGEWPLVSDSDSLGLIHALQMQNRVLHQQQEEMVAALDSVTVIKEQMQGLLARRSQELASSMQQADDDGLFYREMLDRMPSAVLLVRMSDSLIQFANPMATRMFGYSSEELLGESVVCLSQLDTQSAFSIGGDLNTQLARDGVWVGEVKVVCSQGQLKWCSVSVSKFDHARFGLVWLAVYTDISKRVSLEQELMEQKVLQLEMRQNLRNLEAALQQSKLLSSAGYQQDREAIGKQSLLSRRQQQILHHVSEGMTSVEISRKLNISAATVMAHRRDIMRKLDLHSSVALTRYAIQNKA